VNKPTDSRRFRVLTGPARKDAVRKELAASHGIDWTQNVFTLSQSQRTALHDMAKAVGYRKPVSSYFSLGTAYFNYLARKAGV
jgi:hypothetical protein